MKIMDCVEVIVEKINTQKMASIRGCRAGSVLMIV